MTEPEKVFPRHPTEVVAAAVVADRIPFISVYDILKSRGEMHLGGFDCTHYCYHFDLWFPILSQTFLQVYSFEGFTFDKQATLTAAATDAMASLSRSAGLAPTQYRCKLGVNAVPASGVVGTPSGMLKHRELPHAHVNIVALKKPKNSKVA